MGAASFDFKIEPERGLMPANDAAIGLTISEVAQKLSMSEKTIRSMIACGDLPAYRIGGRLIRIRVEDFEALWKPVLGGGRR